MMGGVGASATNYPPQPLETRMHGIYSRLDIDLNGFPGDSVQVVSHAEAGLTALSSIPLIGSLAMTKKEDAYRFAREASGLQRLG